MSEEQPLNVRVAEALGWQWKHRKGDSSGCCWLLPADSVDLTTESIGLFGEKVVADSFSGIVGPLEPCHQAHLRTGTPQFQVPRFDMDGNWAVRQIDEWELDIEHGDTGPSFVKVFGMAHCPTGLPQDDPYCGAWLDIAAEGPTTPIAVCNWFLAAHKKGACVTESLPRKAAS
jgi:hypothetical protein